MADPQPRGCSKVANKAHYIYLAAPWWNPHFDHHLNSLRFGKSIILITRVMFPYGHPLQMAPRHHQRGGWHEQNYAPRLEPRHEERYMSYEYEYRRPNQNLYAQPPNRFAAPSMMPRISSSNHFSGHHLPQRSLTPYPERGHSEPPHYPRHPISNYSDHAAHHYHEASYGRGYSEGGDHRRQHEHDPYSQYGRPQDHRYPAMPMPQRRGGSWVASQPPLDGRLRSTMPDEHRPSRGRPHNSGYEEADWDMQQHQRQKLEHIGEVVDVEGHYPGAGHGRAPLMKGEWPEERYRGGHEEDSGYGSDEGESLVDDEWEEPEEALHHAAQHRPWPRKGDYGQPYEPGAPQEYYQRPSQWSQPNNMKVRDGWHR